MSTNKCIKNVFSALAGHLGAKSQLSALDFIDYVLLFDTSLEIGKVDKLSRK